MNKADTRRAGPLRTATSTRIRIFVVCAFAVSGLSCAKKVNDVMPPIPVRTASVTQESFPVQLTTIGSVEACNTIRVKSKVDGEITAISFKEGDIVKKDQVLFTVDTRPYDVALLSAQANLAKAQADFEQTKSMTARDRAQADNAKVELDRNTVLLSRGTISKEEFDQSHANSSALGSSVAADEATTKAAAGAVEVARAAIDNAKLQLDYCTIRSPLEGKTGSVLLHQGNLVKANDTDPMVVINQMKPIYGTFTLPENKLPQVKDAMANNSLAVSAVITGEEDKPISGNLTFLDNAVDQNTGTIRFKATFANDDNRLWPGQYVNITLRVKILENATIVPTAAVQVGQKGPYVFVVKSDMTVEMKNIAPSDVLDGKTVVIDGLKPNENVVVDGQMRLIPGAKVSFIDDKVPAKAPKK